jgi:hypothetical protein
MNCIIVIFKIFDKNTGFLFQKAQIFSFRVTNGKIRAIREIRVEQKKYAGQSFALHFECV